MKLLIAVLLSIGLCEYARAEITQGLPEPTAAQMELQCRYESQLARGLVSVMVLLQTVTGEVPPVEFMSSYIASFYDQKKPEERTAAVNAATALKWIYLTHPANARGAEAKYYEQCMEGMDMENPPDPGWQTTSETLI